MSENGSDLELVEQAKAIAGQTMWSPERVALLKRMKMPKGATDDEFLIFLEQCKRTGMDPLIDEADCVERSSKKSRKDKNGNWIEEWETKHVFQPREVGMRARADRYPDYRGIACAVVREGDHFAFDPATPAVEHRFNPADPARAKKPILGAWAWVKRAGRQTFPVWTPLAERIQMKNNGTVVTQFWDKKTETMIAKCARADAYRLEYPNAFGGTFLAEEWEHRPDEAEAPAAQVVEAPPALQSRTESVLAKVQALAPQTVSEGVLVEPKPEPAPAAPPAAVPAPVASPAPQTSDKRWLMPAGPKKGTPVGDCSTEDLQEAVLLLEAKIAAEPMAPWTTKARAALDDLREEVESRIATAAGDASQEDVPF